MAIYEYYCPQCRQVFPLRRLMTEVNDPAACPVCGKGSQRVLSNFATKIDLNYQIPAKEPFREFNSQ